MVMFIGASRCWKGCNTPWAFAGSLIWLAVGAFLMQVMVQGACRRVVALVIAALPAAGVKAKGVALAKLAPSRHQPRVLSRQPLTTGL
jgi:hypothetical protein